MRSMNTTDNTASNAQNPYDPHSSGNGHNPADGSSEAGATLRDMWRTRPVRIPSKQGSGAWLAGIAEGIGVRYQISPVLVRLLFVVLSLAAGLGLLTYLTLLIILPRYTVPLSPVEVVFKDVKDERFEHDKTVGWVAGICAIIASIGTFSAVETSTIIAFSLIALFAWLLHTRVPTPPGNYFATAFPYTPTSPASTPTGSSSPQTNPYGSYASRSGAGGVGQEEKAYSAAEGFEDNVREDTPTPPSWDPLGAAPFAWHLPNPDELDAQAAEAERTQKNKKKRKGSGWFVSTVMTLIVIAAVGAVVTLGLAGKDILDGQESSSFRAFSQSTQTPSAEYEESTYRFWGSNGTVDFRDFTQNLPADAPNTSGQTTLHLKTMMANATVKIPEETDGPAFTVTTFCPVNIMSKSNCEDGKAYEVRSTDPKAYDDAPQYTVDLRVSGTLSTISIERG